MSSYDPYDDDGGSFLASARDEERYDSWPKFAESTSGRRVAYPEADRPALGT